MVSHMSGKFRMQDEEIAFETLSCSVPGAQVGIAGKYALAEDALDFRGTLRLQANGSQTMTGWKRVVLKPLDPIFAKDGACTVLKIKIVGPASAPKFGLDRGEKAAYRSCSVTADCARPSTVADVNRYAPGGNGWLGLE